jgi:hypothetical protein
MVQTLSFAKTQGQFFFGAISKFRTRGQTLRGTKTQVPNSLGLSFLPASRKRQDMCNLSSIPAEA